MKTATSLLALALLLGCTAEGTDFEAYPFVAVDRTRPGTTRVTVPVALASWDEEPPRRVVRGPGGGPIDAEASPDMTAKRLQFPFPILSIETEGREHDLKFFAPLIVPFTFGFLGIAGPAGRAATGTTPLIAYPSDIFGTTATSANPLAAFPLLGYDHVHIDPRDPDGETKRDLGLYPLFMAGDWPGRGAYMAIAPFGGTTYGFLGKDEMDWVGFPYPIYLHAHEKYWDSYHVLWPFVNWVEGGGHEGFRIWPFYGHYRKTDLAGREAYDRHWVMWPLVSWARNSENQGTYDEDDVFRSSPTEELFIFPFYGRIDGPDDKDTTILWPFFRYEEIPSQNFWELRAPFPFFIMHHGSDPALAREGRNSERIRFDIWPLAGYKARPGFVRHFFVWPIERFEARDDEWVTDTKFFFVPFVSWHHHHEKEADYTGLVADYQHTRVWPFVLYRRGPRGDVELHALAPILWNDPQGFERIIFPFVRLYEYQRSSQGGTQHRFLLGLASWRHEPPVKDVTDGYSRLSLLFGLIQVRSGGTTPEESPRTGFRLFYLPEISWGGS